MPDHIHLHCHTQYSLLDGACDISALMDKVAKDGQQGIAITDHGNMFGAFNFVTEAAKRNLKAIVGCEFYMVPDRHKQAFSKIKGEKDHRYHQLLLAKNQEGYQNLSKLCSLGFIEGLYGKFPRIDKELILKYHEGLIATSCCLGAEIPQHIIAGKLAEAEILVKWWKDLLGDDFYIELQRHGLQNIEGSGLSQEDINKMLIQFAKKYQIKIIATNDVHYLNQNDAEPHDILLCVNTNSKLAEIDRFKFPNDQFYLKTREEMNKLFIDLPHALDHTMEIYSKVEAPKLKRDIILPNFPIPNEYKDQDDYLRHLVYEGARRFYGSLTQGVIERLEFELKIITEMKFSGYFLIVQDFIKAAREMGVRVGPGRGSAAGSVVAYCLCITGLDPIKYNLLFERFLNPQRISMPDMDIDFDDEGRQKVIDYVVNKYGKEQVAQIVTFSTMAAKSSIRDVGRVLDYPLSDVDQIAKLVPLRPKVHLVDLLNKSIEELRDEYSSEEMGQIN
ncbi:MAG: DNA polymerase III subunit alpha, partial [Saprospiraceae bacterium]